MPFLPIQEGISVCDRSNGHLILDFNHSARCNVHDSNPLAYRQRERQYFSTRKDQHRGHTSVFQAICLTKSMGHIYSLENLQVLISQYIIVLKFNDLLYRVTQKKRELLKNPTKIEEIQEKKLLTEIEPLQLAF